jgi:hypothetical protein
MASPNRLAAKPFRAVTLANPLDRILTPRWNQTRETWREDAAKRIIFSKRALESF